MSNNKPLPENAATNRDLLKNFEDTVLADAWREKEAIEIEIGKIREKELSVVEGSALEESYKIIHDGINEILAALNKEVSVKSLAARKEVLLAREALKTRIFEKVKNNVSIFKVSPAYEKYMMQSFQEAVSDVNDAEGMTIILSQSDTAYAQKFSEVYSGKLNVTYDSALIGGVQAFSKKTGRYADYSLNARIDKEKQRYDERTQLNLD